MSCALWKQFHTPAEWLRLPPDRRPVIRYGVMGGFQYMIYWAWVAKFCVGEGTEVEDRRADILAYFHAESKYSVAVGLAEVSDVVYSCGERDWREHGGPAHVPGQ